MSKSVLAFLHCIVSARSKSFRDSFGGGCNAVQWPVSFSISTPLPKNIRQQIPKLVS